MVSDDVKATQSSGGTGKPKKLKMGRRIKKNPKRGWIQMALRKSPVTKKLAKGEKIG